MRALAFAILLAAGPAGAQTMYRCGNTFSQQPCGPDAQELKAPGVPQPRTQQQAAPQLKSVLADTVVPDPTKIQAMKARCRDYITNVPSWKDRESLKIGDVYRGDLERRTVNGASRVVRIYATGVNAKNSYGGYTGEKPALCFVNEAETEVLDLYVAG